jgi:hypothetical protein
MNKLGDSFYKNQGTPFPDPLGIVEHLTEGKLYDPIRHIFSKLSNNIRCQAHYELLSLARKLEDN